MDKNKIVLIIDDDDDDRSLFSEALKEINNSIICLSASDGNEGLTLLKNQKKLPDIIFLDLNMPCLNGKQCLAEIKKNKKLAHIPVIIYSTTRRQEDVEETKKLGAAYFLTKPALFNDICNELYMLLKEKWEKNILVNNY